MNGMIRYAHRVSLTEILLTPLFLRKAVDAAIEDYRERWQVATSSVKRAEVRLKLNDFQDQIGILLAKHLVRSSIIFFGPVYFCVLASMAIKVATMELWNSMAKWIPGLEYLEVEAERAAV
jgi:hypothetical protein